MRQSPSERSKSSHTREEWAALKERERVAEAFGDKVAKFAEKVTRGDEISKAARAKIAADRAQLGAREADLDRREREAAEDRLAAQNARSEAEEAHRVANATQRAAERARAQAEADRQYARDLVAKIEWMPPEVDDWFDRRKVGDGRTMRDLFNEDTKKRRAVLAEVRALTATDAPQQTGPRTRDHGLGG